MRELNSSQAILQNSIARVLVQLIIVEVLLYISNKEIKHSHANYNMQFMYLHKLLYVCIKKTCLWYRE